jgi:prophage regulatory protein
VKPNRRRQRRVKKPSPQPQSEPAPPPLPAAGAEGSPTVEPGVENELLTVEQMAKILQVCKKSVFEMAKAGRLPRPVRLTPRCVRWRRSDLGEWIKAL